MGKGLVIDFLANPADEEADLDEEEADEELPSKSSSADALISSIQVQLDQLRRELASGG